ncbi:MAG: hypothetical protein MJE77_00035 [Proteobacteria bacterium]|nr:hypothetical protein [Pseudomonadota bacterium]
MNKALTLLRQRFGGSAGYSVVIRQLVTVVCPPQVEEFDLVDAITEQFELSVRAMPGDTQALIRAGVVAYDLGALARFGRRSRDLDRARAQRYFALWRGGLAIQQEFAKAVKGLLALACYEMPAMQEAIGYRPDEWIEKVKRRRLAVYGEDIRRRAANLHRPDPLRTSWPGRESASAVANRDMPGGNRP